MASRWLRRRGRIDLGQARAEAAELLGRGKAREALELVRAVLAQAPGETVFTLLGLRAETAALEGVAPDEGVRAELAGWLEALPAAAVDALAPAERAEVAFWRGWLALLAGDRAGAEDQWHTAWQLDDEREDARAGLIGLWAAAGACPEWGLALVEAVVAEG